MKRIIVRDKIMPVGHINAAFIELCNGNEYNSLQNLLMDYNSNEITNKLYSEEILNNSIKDTELYKLYNSALELDEDNKLFKVMYQIDDEFAIHLTENIYLYHIATKKEKIYSLVVPWHYVDSKKYIGDTWWEQDSEIIENINKLSLIEFFKRYKGY